MDRVWAVGKRLAVYGAGAGLWKYRKTKKNQRCLRHETQESKMFQNMKTMKPHENQSAVDNDNRKHMKINMKIEV